MEWNFEDEHERDDDQPARRQRVAFRENNGYGGNGGAKKAPYKHKTNRGSMFENDRKTKETQPDFTGSIDVNGTIFWLHAWKEMTQSGKKRLSVSVQVQEERSMQEQRSQGPSQPRQRESKW